MFRAIVVGKVNYVLEVDIKGYFQNIVHEHLMTFIQQRIKDRSLLRLIGKWLHAGVLEDGQLLPVTKGTFQGAVISPILANVYLHYVLDEWMETVVKPRMRGEMHLIRYADDLIVCFQHREDAERVASVLRKRLAKYGLELHEGKTRLIAFGRFAEENLRRQGQGSRRPSTSWASRTSVGGVGMGSLRSMSGQHGNACGGRCSEWRSGVGAIGISRYMSSIVGSTACSGAITSTMAGGEIFLAWISFREFTRRIWYKWLRRRGQRRRLSWEAFRTFLRRFPLPRPHVTQHGVV